MYDTSEYLGESIRNANPSNLAGQSHLISKGMVEWRVKMEDERMEERDLQALETIFAQVEDPRMNRTRAASIAR
jgi:hypothetical protein